MPYSICFKRYILLLLLVFFVVTGCSTFIDAGELPEIKKDCAVCHSGDPEKKNILLMPLPDLCTGCHPERIEPAEHSVNVVPSMTVRELPLSEGKITCVTCHDPHSNQYGKMLRVAAEDLCRMCHRN